MSPNTPETRAEIRKLREETHNLTVTINRLVKARTRPLWLAVVGLVLAVGVSGTVAAYTIHQLHNNAITACKSGNVRLSKQQALWDGIILQSRAKTPEEKRAGERLKNYTDAVFSPRDCQHLDEPWVGPDRFPDLGLK